MDMVWVQRGQTCYIMYNHISKRIDLTLLKGSGTQQLVLYEQRKTKKKGEGGGLGGGGVIHLISVP